MAPPGKASRSKSLSNNKTQAAAKSSDPARLAKSSCPILALPPELRNKICDLIFEHCSVLILTWSIEYNGNPIRTINAGAIKWAIRLVSICKAFREALPILARKSHVFVEGSGCQWGDLPPYMTSLFLVHVENVHLPQLGCQFELNKMPRLRKVVLGTGTEYHFMNMTLQEKTLEDIIPIIMGDQDQTYIYSRLELLDSRYGHSTAVNHWGKGRRSWTMLRELSGQGVCVEMNFSVMLDIYVGDELNTLADAGDNLHHVDILLTFEISTKQVLRRRALVNKNPTWITNAAVALELLRQGSVPIQDMGSLNLY